MAKLTDVVRRTSIHNETKKIKQVGPNYHVTEAGCFCNVSVVLVMYLSFSLIFSASTASQLSLCGGLITPATRCHCSMFASSPVLDITDTLVLSAPYGSWQKPHMVHRDRRDKFIHQNNTHLYVRCETAV